jgi:hypothetical protein
VNDAVDFTQSHTIVFWKGPGSTLTYSRTGIQGGVSFLDGTGIAEFVLSGQQSLEFRPIEVPLHVSVAGTSPDGTMSFASTADVPMVPSSYIWHFVPNDLNTARAEMIGSCGGMTTCSYKPAVPGLIHLWANPARPNAGALADASAAVGHTCGGGIPNSAVSATLFRRLRTHV